MMANWRYANRNLQILFNAAVQSLRDYIKVQTTKWSPNLKLNPGHLTRSQAEHFPR